MSVESWKGVLTGAMKNSLSFLFTLLLLGAICTGIYFLARDRILPDQPVVPQYKGGTSKTTYDSKEIDSVIRDNDRILDEYREYIRRKDR